MPVMRSGEVSSVTSMGSASKMLETWFKTMAPSVTISAPFMAYSGGELKPMPCSLSLIGSFNSRDKISAVVEPQINLVPLDFLKASAKILSLSFVDGGPVNRFKCLGGLQLMSMMEVSSQCFPPDLALHCSKTRFNKFSWLSIKLRFLE